MTEEELRAHRRAQDVARVAQEQQALDDAVGQLTIGEAISTVSRATGAGGNAREAHRDQMRLAVALRMTGCTQQEIADEMGLSHSVVKRLLLEGQQLDARHSLLLLETRAIPLAVDNLIAGLAAGNEKYTLETLRGGGILKPQQGGGGGGLGIPSVMQIVFAAPPGGTPLLPPGVAHGAPLTMDIEKVE